MLLHDAHSEAAKHERRDRNTQYDQHEGVGEDLSHGVEHRVTPGDDSGGKSGGYRTLVSARIGSRYVFLHGFPKNDKANITQDEKKALQFAGKAFLQLSGETLSKALQSGVLLEVHCEQDH